MPQRQDWSRSVCPIARSMDVLGDAWALRILGEAMVGVRRYDDFRRRLGIADNVLSRRLGQLVDEGVLARAPYRGPRRTQYEYVLTDAGKELFPILSAMALWGERHTRAPGPTGHLRVVHTACGTPSSGAEACSHCGTPLTKDNSHWERLWETAAAAP
ncbi:winged helix-turn-helix transcriptional regulator [Streptomyces sp. NPDC050560]|uniref:winged helix-turn-helix transcriptional regulator n=1 Tax=Streptomyces sp. NPDC050560 TaxID=3365630 RepID=UPI00378D6AF8